MKEFLKVSVFAVFLACMITEFVRLLLRTLAGGLLQKPCLVSWYWFWHLIRVCT